MQIWLMGILWLLNGGLSAFLGILGGETILREYLLTFHESRCSKIIKLGELPMGNMIMAGAGVSALAQLLIAYGMEIIPFIKPIVNFSLVQWAGLLVQSVIVGGILGPAGFRALFKTRK
ncbi:MAG: hypothetical protein V1860_00370 [bacterium]